MNIQVNKAQWPGFTDKDLQDLFTKHMHGKKTVGRKRKKNKKTPAANIYIGLGKNPMTFSVTICPYYPCP